MILQAIQGLSFIIDSNTAAQGITDEIAGQPTD